MATIVKPATTHRLAEWWLLRSKAERVVLSVVSGLGLGAIAWFTLWKPLVADIDRTTQLIASQRAALAEARRQADDIASLARNAVVTSVPPDARGALDAALAHQGLKPAALDRLDNDHLRATFDAIGFDALVTLLDRLQREAKLRVVELTATARVEPGEVRAEVVISP